MCWGSSLSASSATSTSLRSAGSSVIVIDDIVLPCRKLFAAAQTTFSTVISYSLPVASRTQIDILFVEGLVARPVRAPSCISSRTPADKSCRDALIRWLPLIVVLDRRSKWPSWASFYVIAGTATATSSIVRMRFRIMTMTGIDIRLRETIRCVSPPFVTLCECAYTFAFSENPVSTMLGVAPPIAAPASAESLSLFDI